MGKTSRARQIELIAIHCADTAQRLVAQGTSLGDCAVMLGRLAGDAADLARDCAGVKNSYVAQPNVRRAILYVGQRAKELAEACTTYIHRITEHPEEVIHRNEAHNMLVKHGQLFMGLDISVLARQIKAGDGS